MRFITEREPTSQRASRCEGSKERVLSEPAVMLAVAQWMFELGAARICIHPDGMHIKQFDIAGWLRTEGFRRRTSEGTTAHAGVWTRGGRTLEVRFRPGRGDVVADIQGERILVEAKGGCINSRYPGILSQLRTHLYEAVGSLFDAPAEVTRLIAAVPCHSETEKLAIKMTERCRKAGVQIALVSPNGHIRVLPE